MKTIAKGTQWLRLFCYDRFFGIKNIDGLVWIRTKNVKNKGAALAVCLVLLIASVGYYFYTQSSRNNSDVGGIEKNWWEDPNSSEDKWVEQSRGYSQQTPNDVNKTVEVEENRDHYTEMIQFKSTNSKRYGLLKREIQELQGQLQNSSNPQDVEILKMEIAKRQNRLKEIKEDDQFIQLLTGQ